MRVLTLVLTAASVVVSLPALAQEPPPPEAAPPPAMPPPPPAGYPPPAAYPPAAPPLESGRFGGAGQLAFAVDLPLMNGAPQLAIIHESQSMGGPSATVFAIQPSLDYFVAPGVSIGGLLGLARQSQSVSGMDLTSTVLSVEARVGYNAAFSDLVSIWPRAGIGYSHASTDFYGQTVTQSYVALIVEAPILFHPAPHFFLGAGPFIATQLTNSASSGGTSMDQPKSTDLGLQAMIGGHFGGM